MSKLKMKAVANAIKVLEGVGAVYTVSYGGNVYSNAPEPPRAAPVSKKRKYGSLKAIYQPVLESMKIGDVVVLRDQYSVPLESLRSALTGWAASNWGAKTVITHLDSRKGELEIMRIGGDV